jgi:hypothetical protein
MHNGIMQQSHTQDPFQRQAIMWENHYMDLLKHNQQLVREAAQQIIKLERSLEQCYQDQEQCDMANEIRRSGLLGEIQVHKNTIRHTHGFVSQSMVEELARGAHKNQVAQ